MDIVIANIDIVQVPADLLILKHADGFYGADRSVARILGFDGSVPIGRTHFLRGTGLSAKEVVFVGVGPLHEFRYERIQEFASKAVTLAEQRGVRHIGLTIHGPGYGLDAEESFLSLLAGLIAGKKGTGGTPQKITVAERSEKRCELLSRILAQRLTEFGLTKNAGGAEISGGPVVSPESAAAVVPTNIVRFGARAEEKPRLFVAMPFAKDFIDEFDIAFCEAARENGYLCERLDLEAFVGDIFTEIKTRIVGSHGVIALLNDHNPNVFLEIGFALAHKKPTILVAEVGTKLPFDVSGQKCIIYENIRDLREGLTAEIASLKAQGILARSA